MKKILGFTAVVILLSNILFNANIIKISASSFDNGLIKTGEGIGYNVAGSQTLAVKIGVILKVSSTFLGVIFFGLMIYAGFIWMLARGNEQEAEKAKNIIIYSVIGLAVILGAYAITNIIYNVWFKSPITP